MDPSIYFSAVINGVVAEEHYFSVPDGAVRVIHFSGPKIGNTGPIVFVPGWASTPWTWRDYIPVLAEHGPVHYFETREKSSSQFGPEASMSAADAIGDLVAYLDSAFADRDYGIIAASTGANSLIAAWPSLTRKPAWATLLLPHLRMPIPRWAPLARHLPEGWLRFIGPAGTLLMGRLNISRREPEQLEGILAILGSADMGKLRRSLLGWYDQRIDLQTLPKIDRPTLVIGASHDRFHPYRSSSEVARRLPQAVLIDQDSFAGAHGTEAAQAIFVWRAGVQGAADPNGPPPCAAAPAF